MRSLAAGFFECATQTPEKTAFVLDRSCISYAVLAQAVYAAVEALENRSGSNSEGEGRLALTTQNHFDVAVWYLAAALSERQLILVDPLWPEQTTRGVLETLNPEFLVGQWPENQCRAWRRRCLQTPFMVQRSSLYTRHSESPSHNTQQLSFCPGSGSELLSVESSRVLHSPDFLIGFTSGSSGQPKAFVRNQQSWIESFKHSTIEFALAQSDCVFAPGPLSHGLSFYAMAETLNRGATFCCSSIFDVRECLDLLLGQRVDTLVAVPTILERLSIAMLDHQSCELVASRLQRIISAGAKLSSRVRDSWCQQIEGLLVSEYYGASELSFVSVSHSCERRPINSVGRAFDGVEISIVDEAGKPVPAGRSGKVMVKSDMLADAYLLPEPSLSDSGLPTPLTHQPLDSCGRWASVGDYGFIDANGNLHLQERLDRQVTIGGLNVQPSAVEGVLAMHLQGVMVCVVSFPDEVWGSTLAAIIECSMTNYPDVDGLMEACRHKLSKHEVPRYVYQIAELPQTSSGKIAYAQLAQMVTASDASLRRLSK